MGKWLCPESEDERRFRNLLPHPSASSSNRFPLDQRLRRNGFAIYSRPKVGEVLWIRDGERWTQAAALSCCGGRMESA